MSEECTVTAFTTPNTPASPENQTRVYVIWNTSPVTATLTIPAWTQTPCNYPEILAFSPALPFSSSPTSNWIQNTSGRTISVTNSGSSSTTTTLFATISVTSTLVSYAKAFVSTTASGYSFNAAVLNTDCVDFFLDGIISVSAQWPYKTMQMSIRRLKFNSEAMKSIAGK